MANEFLNIVDALLKCPSIQNTDTRSDIINLLPDDISNNIDYRSSARPHVMSIVKTCQNYEDGLEKLLEVLRTYEGNSLSMQAVDALFLNAEPNQIIEFQQTIPETKDNLTYPKEPKLQRDLASSSRKKNLSNLNSESFAELKEKSWQRNHLCLIAVQDYLYQRPLNFPISDAVRLRDTLTTFYTFAPESITFLTNPTRTELLAKLEELERKIEEDDNLLIFFAGHGEWNKRRRQGYWLPKDAETDNKANWISNSDIRDQLNGFQARHVLLISDACFSGGILDVRKSGNYQEKTIPELQKSSSRQALTSGMKEEAVSDYSEFINYLILRLTENEKDALTAEELYGLLRHSVIYNADNRPEFGVIHKTGHDSGEYVFYRQ